MTEITYIGDSGKNPDNILRQSIEEYEQVLVLGWDKEGMFNPKASTNLNAQELLWLIEQFKTNLMLGLYSNPPEEAEDD